MATTTKKRKKQTKAAGAPTSRQQTVLGDDFATNQNLDMAFESQAGQKAMPLTSVPDAPAEPDPNQFEMDMGKAEASPPKLTSDVETTSLALIDTRPDIFQARDVDSGKSFDQARVQQIVDNWNPERFDPVVLVRDGERFVILSGHHRLEAMRQMGAGDIPSRIVEGDLNDPDDRRRMIREAIVSNFNIAESNIREKATAAHRLHENGWDLGDIAANMRLKGRNDAAKLLWLHEAGATILHRVTLQPELAPVGIELGRAIAEGKINPETAQGLFTRWDRDYLETDKVPGARSIRKQIDVLAEVQSSAGTQAGMLEGFAGDVQLSTYDEQRQELSELTEQANRNKSRLYSCEALAQELGVTIKQLQKAAHTRQDYLTAEQERKARIMLGIPPRVEEVDIVPKKGSGASAVRVTEAKPGKKGEKQEPSTKAIRRGRGGRGKRRVDGKSGGRGPKVNITVAA